LAVEAAATDIVDVPEPGALMVTGLKPTVKPAVDPPDGDVSIPAVSVIGESNPPETAVVMVNVPLEPRPTESALVEGVTEKPVVTVKVTLAVFVIPPPVAVTVMG